MKLKESINPLMSNVAQMNEYNVSNLLLVLLVLKCFLCFSKALNGLKKLRLIDDYMDFSETYVVPMVFLVDMSLQMWLQL